ncbi:MAG: hypothetical protein K1000chlam4_00976 [Chlamydiae bacterium]|nr:hypothetical protein [Chlamydiota bacterium]
MGGVSVALGPVRGAVLPLRSEEEGVKGGGPLKGRATIHWAEVPIIAAMVACVLGVALSLILEYNGAAVLFGIASVGSISTFFLARRYYFLKAENVKYEAANKLHNELLAAQGKALATLRSHNRKYGAENKKHRTENERQEALTGLFAGHHVRSKEQFEGFIEELSLKLKELGVGTSGLGALVGVLRTFIATLSEKVNVEKLANLTGRQEALSEASQSQLTFMDQLRTSFQETFMQILRATQARVIEIVPDRAEDVQEAFGEFESSVGRLALPTLPPAIEGQA